MLTFSQNSLQKFDLAASGAADKLFKASLIMAENDLTQKF
jgi:hypothetical protein